MQITDLLTELGIPFKAHGQHHHTTQNFVNIDCPYCSPSTERYLLGIHTAGLYCNCWQCGSKKLYHVLADISGSRQFTSLFKQLEKTKTAPDKPRGKLVLPYGLGELLPAHRRYLQQRRFDPDELVRLWGIKGIGVAPALSWRIWIPIELKGAVVSWTTRTIGNANRRYHTADSTQESISAKTLLYGEDYCRHSVVVVEGPTDAWRIGPGCVALMGMNYTKAQLRKIARYPVRAICLDKAAQDVADRLCSELACFDGKTHKIEIDVKDPDSASERDIREIRKHFLE